MDIGGRNFKKSKVYFLHKLYRDIQEVLAPYMRLEFIKRDIVIYASSNDRTKKIKKTNELILDYIHTNYKIIPIVDMSQTADFAIKLQEEFNKIFHETVKFPLTKIIPDDATSAITITEPKIFYEQTKEEDPYKSVTCKHAIPLQNITTQTTVCKAVVMVLLKELAIKSELLGSKPFVSHPKNIEDINYIAVIDPKEDEFTKARLDCHSIKTFSLSDEEQIDYEEILYKVPVGEEAEYIVTSKKMVMLITKTLIYPLPDFEKLNQKYEFDSTIRYFSKKEILSLIAPDDSSKWEEQLSLIESTQGIPSDKLLKIADKSLKSKLKKIVEHPLKYTARDKKTKELYIGMLGITPNKSIPN